MNAQRLKELKQLAEEIHRLGSLESYLPPGTKLPKGPKVKLVGQPTAADRERLDRLMQTSYGLPSNPDNVPTRFF